MPRVTFLPDGVSREVPPGTTILEAALAAGAPVGHACGGQCACSTCHVYVREGFASLSAQEDDEADVLDKAFDVRPSSRLACQTRVGPADVAVEITPESRRAYLDEHPAAAPAAPAVPPPAKEP